MATMTAPPELHDHSDPGWPVIAIRIDGPQDTRGRAAAAFASEWGIDFTAVRVRRTAYREDTDYIADAKADGIKEPYDGWPWRECATNAVGAHPYWKLAEECRPA
jgi:hypothetical protein